MGVSHGWLLPAEHQSAGLARRLVGEVLVDHAIVDDAVLVTSELVANAVDYGAGPIDLELRLDAACVRITVTHDAAAGEPTVRRARIDDEGGRGLAITAALAARWGWNRPDQRMSVWAEFTRH
jgi:anti-sigma regulatory factor (Ser/Thr protein kinase)